MTTTPPNALRRLALTAFTIMGMSAVTVGVPTTVAYADHCEVVACWPECHPVPGGRWCRQVCRRHCWREPQYEPPTYVPQPTYRAPSYAPASRALADPVPALFVLGGVALIVVLVIAAAVSAGSATDEIKSATKETECETAETEALIARLEAAAREADDHLDRYTRRHSRDWE